MEEILASIKRIIAEDGEAAVGAPQSQRRPRAPKPVQEVPVRAVAQDEGAQQHAPTESDAPQNASRDVPAFAPPPAEAVAAEPTPDPEPAEEVLELTDKLDEVSPDQAQTAEAGPEAGPAAAPPPLLSSGTTAASRASLAQLSAMVVKPEIPLPENTLEGLVREMLRPMLKEWLDARLPVLVERMVAKEIARITGRD